MVNVLVLLAVLSNLSVIIATVFEYVAFFTGRWLKVYQQLEVADNAAAVAAESNVAVVSFRVETNHGLWDNGIDNLNCIVTPFGICMYTRASLFAGIILLSVSLIFSVVSTAIVASGGNVGSSGTMARCSAILLTLADIAIFIGILVFTIQHTTCITSCEPEYSFYPAYPDNLSFDWSFILAWVGLFFVIAATVLQYIFSCMADSKHKVGFSPNRKSAKTAKSNIELVRVNEAENTRRV